jgi:hypothetical protein
MSLKSITSRLDALAAKVPTEPSGPPIPVVPVRALRRGERAMNSEEVGRSLASFLDELAKGVEVPAPAPEPTPDHVAQLVREANEVVNSIGRATQGKGPVQP